MRKIDCLPDILAADSTAQVCLKKINIFTANFNFSAIGFLFKGTCR